VVRSPFELYANDELYLSETVTPAEVSAIENLIPSTSWHVGAPSHNRTDLPRKSGNAACQAD